MIGVALRTQCKDFAEEGSGINVLKMIFNIAIKTGIREFGSSPCRGQDGQADTGRKPTENAASIVQVRDRLLLCIRQIVRDLHPYIEQSRSLRGIAVDGPSALRSRSFPNRRGGKNAKICSMIMYG